MKTLARIASVSLVSIVALAVPACGGRTAAFEDEDDGGTAAEASADTGGGVGDDTSVGDDGDIWVDADPGEDAGWIDAPDPDDAWWSDTGSAGFDTGVGVKDSGTGVKDSGVIGSDTGVIVTDSSVTKDSGIIVIDGGAIDSGTKDTGFDAGTIYTTCAKISAATCTPAFATCCKANGFTWDPIGCDDISRNWCDDAVDGVVAGKTTYNPAYADACAAGWKAMTTACEPHMFDWVKNQSACSQLFNGTAAPGAPCTRSTECRVGPGETAWCDESSNRCRAVAISPLGGACNYFGASIKWCDKGLTCNVTTGRCVTATPIGGSCFGIDDTACGIGYSCKGGKCAVGSPAGASCVRDLECASWECSLGKCTSINVEVASKALCGGI